MESRSAMVFNNSKDLKVNPVHNWQTAINLQIPQYSAMPIVIAYGPDSVIKMYCFQEFIMEFELGEIKDMHA